MFKPDELVALLDAPWFLDGYRSLERAVVWSRIGAAVPEVDSVMKIQMSRFSQAALASAANWDIENDRKASEICRAAADIEAGLAALAYREGDDAELHVRLLTTSVLFDLAQLQGTAASYAARNGLCGELRLFLSRSRGSLWGALRSEDELVDDAPADEPEAPLFEAAIGDLLRELGGALQRADATGMDRVGRGFDVLKTIATRLEVGIGADLTSAIEASARLRMRHSTLSRFTGRADVPEDVLRKIGSPSELWPAQERAIESGLLEPYVTSFGLAAPTGTGKTAITRLLLAHYFHNNPAGRAIYIVPSRALCAEVSRTLSAAFAPLGKITASLGATLTLESQVTGNRTMADLLVLTPEKGDLLLRVDRETMESVGLVIVDEAHHIEQGTRGILLEFYLWRLRNAVEKKARFVQLSAVTPNIGELVDWLAEGGGRAAITVEERTGRLRVGTFETDKQGQGQLSFGGGSAYEILSAGEINNDPTGGLAGLAHRLSKTGVVLVLTTSPERAEHLALQIANMRDDLQEPSSHEAHRLDARVERELYPGSEIRTLFHKRVTFHHAQIPPRIREAIEGVISQREIDIVVATTTLAEGVNFPFSTVIIETLIGKTFELSPRSLWNIAGRAGRFGVDTEGHCILFRPSQWATKLKHYKLDDYFHSAITNIPPVKSALASGIEELFRAVEENRVSEDMLGEISLSKVLIAGKASEEARRIRGLLNVMRVGYAHAASAGAIDLSEDAAPEFEANVLLGAAQVDPSVRAFATTFAKSQRGVVRRASQDNERLIQIAARIGWSLESQLDLYNWLNTRDDWQLEQFGNLVRGGRLIDVQRLGYLLGPVSKLMAEFEGETLGGYTAFVAAGWIDGLPLTDIRDAQFKRPDFRRLVKVLYARVQYLLPWALFGLSELADYVAEQRELKIGTGIRDLSFLAAEGVPNFDALNLVLQLDVERVDASRLSRAYHRSGVKTDAVSWLRSLKWETIAGIVSGRDKRRIDPDLRQIWTKLSG